MEELYKEDEETLLELQELREQVAEVMLANEALRHRVCRRFDAPLHSHVSRLTSHISRLTHRPLLHCS